MNKSNNINSNEYKYHNTKLLLKKYRDIIWSLEVSVQCLKNEFEDEYGTTIDEFLDTAYQAGMDLAGTELEYHSKSIVRSNKMISLINRSVEIMRNKHKYGEVYYWILYFTYLSPHQLKNNDEIIEALKPHLGKISRRTYFLRSKEAIDVLSSILWAYTSKNTINILNELLPELEVAQ